jgi:O-antigen/teichoic acid export membrane protein
VRGSAPLVSLAAVVAACGIIETASLAVLARALHPGLAIRLVRPTRAELRALYGFGLQAFVVTLALTLIAYTDTTVVGVAVGAASVALYALPLQLVEYIRIVAGGASGVWVPRLTVMASRGDLPGLRAAYVTVTRVTMFLATFLVVNIVFLGPPFLGLWVGPAFSDVHGIVLCLSLAMLLHIYAVTAPMSFYYAMNILRVPAAVLLLEALANLGLSLFLARRFGVIGVALGTLIPAAVVGSVVLPPFLRKRLGLPARDGLRALAPSIGLLVAGGLVHLGLRETVGSHSFALLALKGLLSVPAMALVFFLMFPRDDRDWLVRQVQRIVGLRSSIGATVPAIGALLRRGRVAR